MTRPQIRSDNEWGDARRVCIYGRNCGNDAIPGAPWGIGFCEIHMPAAVKAARHLDDSDMLVGFMKSRPYLDDMEHAPAPLYSPITVNEDAVRELKAVLAKPSVPDKPAKPAKPAEPPAPVKTEPQPPRDSRIKTAIDNYEKLAPAHPSGNQCVDGHTWETPAHINEAILDGCKHCAIEYAYRQILES